MAVTSGTVTGIKTIRGANYTPDGIECCLVQFTMSGTYAQADDSILSAVPTAIEDIRRDGRVVTLVDACIAHGAPKASDPTDFLGPGAPTVSGANITFDLNDGDYTTEYANATAIVSQAAPMGFYVTFTTA